MKRLMKAGIIAMCLLIQPVLASSSPTFELIPTGRETWLLVTGGIEDGTAERLRAYATQHELDGVALSSPGGRLIEGMRMGQIIRDHRLATYVPAGGACLSACFFALIGGIDRSVGDGAEVGVHQFSGVPVEGAEALTQAIAADLLGYVMLMGVAPDVLAIGMAVPPGSMHIFSAEELGTLQITGRDWCGVSIWGDSGATHRQRSRCEQLQRWRAD